MVLFCLFLNSELQGIGLNEKFLHYCEKWVLLLERSEEALRENVANSLPALREQQKTLEVNCAPCPWSNSPGAGVREQ